jgi:hypothetical protein
MLQKFRRIVVRHEHKLDNRTAAVDLACIRILLRMPAITGRLLVSRKSRSRRGVITARGRKEETPTG